MTTVVITEEIYFRYLSFKLIKSKYVVIISSIVFALSHLDLSVFHITSESIPFLINSLCGWFLMGLLFGLSYKISKSLFVPITLHLCVNFLMLLLIEMKVTEVNSLFLIISDNLQLIILLIALFSLKEQL